MTRLFIAITYIFFAIYGFYALKSSFKSKWLRGGYFLLTLGVFCYFLFEVLIDLGSVRYDSDKLLVFAVFFAFYILVLILGGIMILEDVVRLLRLNYGRLKEQIFKRPTKKYWPERRAVVGRLALFLGFLPFGALLYGVFEGRYNFKVITYELEFEDLPLEFDGYTITHFSDVHAGGLDNRSKVIYAVDLINDQKSDTIVFTGDFVDRRSDELEQWQDVFSRLAAPDGKFSVLGNHDYGDYFSRWTSEEEQEGDLQKLKQLQMDMGFTVLCDLNHVIARGDKKLMLIGSENWSASEELMQKGNFENALNGVDSEDFKIVLTHDPSHWEEKLIDHKYHFHLTLSGHTHGYQFGLEIPDVIKWTPVKWRYKYWAGMYKEKEQFINVNRGFGYTGFPGRIGIWPEISVITLRKKHSI